MRCPRSLSPNPKGPGAEEYCAFHDGMSHRAVDYRYLQKQLQKLVNKGISKSSSLTPGSPEARVQRDVSETHDRKVRRLNPSSTIEK